MNAITKMWSRFTGAESRELKRIIVRKERARFTAMNGGGSSISAANTQGPSPGWNGTPSNRDEDAGNKEYLYALAEVLQRSQDLDVNSPDLRGFHRTRTAQIVGPHVKFKSVPKPEEIGIEAEPLLKTTGEIDRIRHLHSRTGGFDSTGHNRSEGEQQQRAVLTSMIHGSCLIHRVWRPENKMLPLSLELIPGVRISTPYNRMGDPKLSYGIEYEDTHRTRVVAYHVRRVSKTIGDSFIPDFEWDRLPAEDCSLLSLTEAAGMDRAMPLSVANVRMIRNRSEFIESSVESARAQSQIYAVTETAPGTDPFNLAADDTDQTDTSGARPIGFTNIGGVKMLYAANGEKVTSFTAKLPGPDFGDFMSVTDERLARGLTSSVSRFTRKVNSSWAGGRLEDQQDDPIVDQYRRTFVSAWQRVNEWFLEAVWLAGAVELPGYSSANSVYWSEFRAEFPGKLHVNPADAMAAREKGYMLRTTTPQQASEEDGKDLRENLRQWGEAMKLVADTEKQYGLFAGTLMFLLSGKTISTSAGDDIGAPVPAEEPQPGQTNAKKPKLKLAGGA